MYKQTGWTNRSSRDDGRWCLKTSWSLQKRIPVIPKSIFKILPVGFFLGWSQVTVAINSHARWRHKYRLRIVWICCSWVWDPKAKKTFGKESPTMAKTCLSAKTQANKPCLTCSCKCILCCFSCPSVCAQLPLSQHFHLQFLFVPPKTEPVWRSPCCWCRRRVVSHSTKCTCRGR